MPAPAPPAEEGAPLVHPAAAAGDGAHLGYTNSTEVPGPAAGAAATQEGGAVQTEAWVRGGGEAEGVGLRAEPREGQTVGGEEGEKAAKGGKWEKGGKGGKGEKEVWPPQQHNWGPLQPLVSAASLLSFSWVHPRPTPQACTETKPLRT